MPKELVWLRHKFFSALFGTSQMAKLNWQDLHQQFSEGKKKGNVDIKLSNNVRGSFYSACFQRQKPWLIIKKQAASLPQVVGSDL